MKTKAEHTKGPVPVVADRGYVKLGNVTFSYSPYHHRGGELERMVALVEAAPDLLEELEGIIRIYERDCIQSRFKKRPSGEGYQVFILKKQADRIRALLAALNAEDGGKDA